MISVDFLDVMGTDVSIVNAARVSFQKQIMEADFDDRDVKLLTYLAKHGHWSPFSHAFLTFRIRAPIFVARQLAKHQVGLAWNEVSRRYVDSTPEFYRPTTWRKRPDSGIKQGSVNDKEFAAWDSVKLLDDWADRVTTECLKWYQQAIDTGVCPEQARMVLPQSMMTEWIWSGSLYAFARVCSLRCKPDTQGETRTVGWHIYQWADKFFPHSWEAFKIAGIIPDDARDTDHPD